MDSIYGIMTVTDMKILEIKKGKMLWSKHCDEMGWIRMQINTACGIMALKPDKISYNVKRQIHWN